jgi:rhodanese-related sulfurtransferase
MDTVAPAITPPELHRRLGTAAAPLIIDVRRREAVAADTSLIAGATWRDPFAVGDWHKYLPRHRPVAVYCVAGHEISRNACEALRNAGVDASYLEGGIEAWRALGAPTLKKLSDPAVPSPVIAPTVWVTRERPRIDRIACPWLIRRFIDPLALFAYVAPDKVRDHAQRTGAIPYDVPGVTFTHRGERCSFDALVEDFGLSHPALDRLATIVRGADTDRLDLAPQCAGLLAITLGLSENFHDDHEMLERGMVLYDALYTACRQLEEGRAERHTWKAPA